MAGIQSGKEGCFGSERPVGSISQINCQARGSRRGGAYFAD